jgi:deoxyribonuclease-4
LNDLLPFAADKGVQIVLETTAGQGTYLGGTFTQFPDIFSRIPAQEQLGVCLDLCHVFVAGYDLRDADSYARLWQEFEAIIGIDRLRVIHVNDTERALGSHSDRHAAIGKGILGLNAFRMLMQDPRLSEIPKILETPVDDAAHGEEVALLKSMAR